MNATETGFRRRKAAIFILLLGLAIVSSCRCRGPNENGGTPSGTPSPAPATGTLYAWADPVTIGGLSLPFADHTWVVTYDAPSTCPPGREYWYSWGACHATGPGTTAKNLGRAPADLVLARCICQPDVESYRWVAGDLPHGGIDFYGISGVCHQLANRILFATSAGGGNPITVSGAKGYAVSRWVFGTYGSDTAEWTARKSRCLAAAAPTTPGVAMMRASPTLTLDEDLTAMFEERFYGDYSKDSLEQIRALRRSLFQRKEELDRGVRIRRLARREHANQINELVNRSLLQAAEILGPSGYRTLFGLAPGERIGLVDPTIAERSEPR